MILILERQSRNGVATIAISLTQISHRVMGLEMERTPIKSMEDKYTQSASESRAIVKAKKSPKLQALLERPNFAQYLADKGDVAQS